MINNIYTQYSTMGQAWHDKEVVRNVTQGLGAGLSDENGVWRRLLNEELHS